MHNSQTQPENGHTAEENNNRLTATLRNPTQRTTAGPGVANGIEASPEKRWGERRRSQQLREKPRDRLAHDQRFTE